MKFVRLLSHSTALMLSALLLVPTTAQAQATSTDADCALARDPVRCLARADAIAACADLHGTPKRDCLLTRLPPPDCKIAPKPAQCQLEQDAKEACKSNTGKALSDCLRDNGVTAPKRTKAKKKTVAKKKPAKRH